MTPTDVPDNNKVVHHKSVNSTSQRVARLGEGGKGGSGVL